MKKQAVYLEENNSKDLKCFKRELVIEDGKLYLKDNRRKLEITARTSYRDIYFLLLNVLHGHNSWTARIEKSRRRFPIQTNDFCCLNRWLWKCTHLTTLEKNIAFKLLYNCIPDRDVLWSKGQKRHLLCNFCESEFENLSHLFEKCEVVAPRLEKIGVKLLCQLLRKPFSVEKTTSIVTILLGTFTENKEKTVFHLDQILQYGL